MIGFQTRPQFLDEPLILEELRVLLVDCDRDTLLLNQLALEMVGATVGTAETPSEAFRSFCRVQPNLLISNLNFPKEDGFSLIRRIRNLSPLAMSKIPAIALTACRIDRFCDQAIEAGFDLYHEKPLPPDELVVIVHALVRYREQLVDRN